MNPNPHQPAEAYRDLDSRDPVAAEGGSVDLVAVPDETEPEALAQFSAAVRDSFPRLFIESSMPLALVDSTGRLLAVNGGFAVLVGRSTATLVGSALADLVYA